MQKINLSLSQKTKNYSILFPGNFENLSQEIHSVLGKNLETHNFLLVTDQNIFEKSRFFTGFSLTPAFLDAERFSKNLLVLPPGEIHKNWETVQKILNRAFELGLDRKAIFVSLSGGVYGDLVGFSASIFLRGVDFFQVPTSLLSMVDSSVGGKTGFDTPYGKNLIGSFYQPKGVFCTIDFLQSLPWEEIQNGLCEMIKHAIIASPKHFENLKRLGENYQKTKKIDFSSLESLISESIKIKKYIVEKDETEQGVRAFLNFGHTYGHAIEHLSHFEIPHGRAVGMGCVLAAEEAFRRKICERSLVFEIKNIFDLFDINIKNLYSQTAIKEAMQYDKKKKEGKIRLILPQEIGSVGVFNL